MEAILKHLPVTEIIKKRIKVKWIKSVYVHTQTAAERTHEIPLLSLCDM